MPRLRSGTVALFAGATVLGSIQLSSAQHLTGADRALFIASALKACVGAYGKGGSLLIAKPLFHRICDCAAKGVADRISVPDLINEDDNADLSKENKTIADEEADRCYDAVKLQQKNPRRRSP